MNKIFLATLVPVMMVSAVSAYAGSDEPVNPSASGSPVAVSVDGGKINFSGSVVAAPCAVDNDTDGQNVALGQVPTNRLVSEGDSSSAVNFNIHLTGCDLASKDATDPSKTANYTKASITFNGATAGNSTTLALAGNGAGEITAKNVGIEIFQANVPVAVDGSKATATTNLITGENLIPFSAAYVATAADVVAGTANSTVNFQVSYE